MIIRDVPFNNEQTGINNKKGEPGEEVKAKECHIGCSRRVEQEGEDVHPGSDCHAKGEKQNDKRSENFFRCEIDILEDLVENEHHSNENEIA